MKSLISRSEWKYGRCCIGVRVRKLRRRELRPGADSLVDGPACAVLETVLAASDGTWVGAGLMLLLVGGAVGSAEATAAGSEDDGLGCVDW